METTTKLENMRTKINAYLSALTVTDQPLVEERTQKVLAKLESPEASKYTLQRMATLKNKGYLIVESKKAPVGLIYIYEFALGENREDVMDRHIAYLDKAMDEFQASRDLNVTLAE